MLLKSLALSVKHCITWWNGQTLGTWLYTKRFGCPVGSDKFGNLYYETSDKKRRWVVYHTYSEASAIPPDWHAWMHRIVDIPPSKSPFIEKSWEKSHQENLTGTANSYVPPASLTLAGKQERRKASGDYQAWTPEA